MNHEPDQSALSRDGWTLARYLRERSPAAMPPAVRPYDDVLHVAKLATGAAVPRAVYVVDADEKLLGVITDRRLAREIFHRLDPGLHLAEHTHGVGALLRLGGDAARLTAGALMERNPRSLPAGTTLRAAMRELYAAHADELPVTDGAGRLFGVVRSLDILREWLEDTLLVRLGDETESFY